jgi:hypothetical protein
MIRIEIEMGLTIQTPAITSATLSDDIVESYVTVDRYQFGMDAVILVIKIYPIGLC